jgi:hypothetical protein
MDLLNDLSRLSPILAKVVAFCLVGGIFIAALSLVAVLGILVCRFLASRPAARKFAQTALSGMGSLVRVTFVLLVAAALVTDCSRGRDPTADPYENF